MKFARDEDNASVSKQRVPRVCHNDDPIGELTSFSKDYEALGSHFIHSAYLLQTVHNCRKDDQSRKLVKKVAPHFIPNADCCFSN